MPTAVAMTTFYQDIELGRRRAGLCLDTIAQATRLGAGVVLVDGGTSLRFDYRGRRVDFLSEAHRNGARILEEVDHRPGQLGPGRRQAIDAAARRAGNKPVIWMEEKPTALRLMTPAIRLVESGHAALVVPGRANGISTLPPYQQQKERAGNQRWNELFGNGVQYKGQPLLDTHRGPLDFWFGPRVIGPDAVPVFLAYDGRFGDAWDAIFTPVIETAALGHRVTGLDLAGYKYEQPEEIEEEREGGSELRAKRDRQLASLVEAGEKHARELGLAA